MFLKAPDSFTGSRVNMLIIAGLVSIFVLACLSTAQNPTARNPPVETEYIGRVLDTNSLEPIANAKITLTLEGVPPIVFTDAEGVFRFKVLIQSIISGQIRVDAPGYQVYIRNISITPQIRIIEDIRLTPKDATALPKAETTASTTISTLAGTQLTEGPVSFTPSIPTTIPTEPPSTHILPTDIRPPTITTLSPTGVVAPCVELLSRAWELTGIGPDEESEDNTVLNSLMGKNFIRISYNLHGLTVLPGDASAIIFDQPFGGEWHFISLSEYGQNGFNGLQTVDILLSTFSLNLNEPVGTLHTRFWHDSDYLVDIVSIKACT